jgi:hypothetical protein
VDFVEMKTALKRYGFDDGDPLATWLNAALHEFESAADWTWLEEGPLALQIAAGDNFITLPGDAFKIITLRDVDHTRKLKYWNRHKFTRNIQDQTEQGQIEVYTLIDTMTLQFWRVPVLATNLEVVYQSLCPDMAADDDVPGTALTPFPTFCHYPIVMRAASIALQAENEEDRAKNAQAEYERGLLICLGKDGERELDEPEAVEDTQGYSGSLGRY